MTTATTNELSVLHKQITKVMLAGLEAHGKAQVLVLKYGDELPDDVVEYLQDVQEPNPALLQAITKFLKDNQITAAVEDSQELSELEERLANKRRKRVDNVEFLNELEA